MPRMAGLTAESLKKNPALIPLYFCIAVGALGSTLYTLRLALRNPDVTWSQKKNPTPWEEYRNKQYKLYSPVTDYSKVKCPAPEY